MILSAIGGVIGVAVGLAIAAVLPNSGFRAVSTPGLLDIVAVVNGKYIGIEVKNPNGRQRRPAGVRGRFRMAGGAYILAGQFNTWGRTSGL